MVGLPFKKCMYICVLKHIQLADPISFVAVIVLIWNSEAKIIILAAENPDFHTGEFVLIILQPFEVGVGGDLMVLVVRGDEHGIPAMEWPVLARCILITALGAATQVRRLSQAERTYGDLFHIPHERPSQALDAVRAWQSSDGRLCLCPVWSTVEAFSFLARDWDLPKGFPTTNGSRFFFFYNHLPVTAIAKAWRDQYIGAMMQF